MKIWFFSNVRAILRFSGFGRFRALSLELHSSNHGHNLNNSEYFVMWFWFHISDSKHNGLWSYSNVGLQDNQNIFSIRYKVTFSTYTYGSSFFLETSINFLIVCISIMSKSKWSGPKPLCGRVPRQSVYCHSVSNKALIHSIVKVDNL